MAYSGYRVKIADSIIDNLMMVPSSYSFSRTQRVLASYYDASGTLHEELSPKRTATIQFSVRERNAVENLEIMTALSERNNVSVEYWDDENSVYATGIFKIEDFAVTHYNSRFGTIRYGEMPVVLKEY